MPPPDVVVAAVDMAAAIAIGAAIWRGVSLVLHLSPYDVVGRVDAAILVVVARERRSRHVVAEVGVCYRRARHNNQGPWSSRLAPTGLHYLADVVNTERQVREFVV